MSDKQLPQKRHQNIPASYLTLMKDNKVLLLRRFNTGYEDGNYSMVAGHVDKGETFTQCIIREAEEEAGIFLKPEDSEVMHIMHRNSHTTENNERVDVFFVARQWQGEPLNKEPHKCDDLSWFDLDNLPKNIIPYIRQALEGIKNRIYYSEHGWQ
ncbi:NUDIX domain-containing protein [Patescibacteria group bacterium]|nr:NUDIX domain-containing protein [Patescibacteria group bacterium]MBU1246749.1 NUDIX domain-containing protein [Patescibacteria group bacterium]MBU1519530.1 NUDIX domain-containing protein [Patescibacteria group bacterium]MBU1730066.1 NUDIX domain-containing protein [Patescibacteria group bacterium]MBU1956544.1 NUDIX domain-containing protein [Patescibacteria group bacterium]